MGKGETQEARRKTQEARRKTQEARRKTQEARRKTQEARRKTQEARRKRQDARRKTQEGRPTSNRSSNQLSVIQYRADSLCPHHPKGQAPVPVLSQSSIHSVLTQPQKA